MANRPINRPSEGLRPAVGGRPSANDLGNFLDLPGRGGGGNFTRPGGITTGGALAGGALAGGAAAAFLHDNPRPFPNIGERPGTGGIASTLPARPGGGESGIGPSRPGEGGEGVRPGRPGNIFPNRPNRPGQGGSGEQGRPGDWANHRPNRIPDWNRWSNWRNDHRNDIIHDWHNHWHNNNWHVNNWFNNNWWNHNHWHYPYYPGFNCWAWAAWPGVMGWVDYGWTQPIAYNYGQNVYYQGDQVYYGDQPVASTEEYAQQALAIAQNAPAEKPAASDWMPLGVYAITPDGEPTGADPTMFLQLAVSKQGVINGTFQNTATDDVKQVEGMVDKQTQRAAWTPAGKDWPIVETGIVNLTQDTTPALIHFADGSTQQLLLVRLDKPEGDATQTD